MKTSVHETYGPPEVMVLKDVKKPSPKEDEVLIKVHATTVTSGDCEGRIHLLSGCSLDSKKPRISILGSELSGEVEATGKDIKSFKKGDLMIGGTDTKLGANAEYVCIKEKDAIAIKPVNMTFEEAASVPFGATTALFFLRDKGHIQKGQKVLIYGALGSVEM